MLARTKNRGLIYIRRSSTKQDSSLEQQLEWALRSAQELCVRVCATMADLDTMVNDGLIEKNGLYVDDGITGADVNRPGFTAFRTAALSDKAVSHVFIHHQDRFARPELMTQATTQQQELQLAGISVVYSTRIAHPQQRGAIDVGDTITTMMGFHESGEFLQKLASRITETKSNLAKGGFWTGGRPPYGFVRILVDASGKELQVLQEGMYIRQAGCHVRIKPEDKAKIEVWLQILVWYGVEKRGIKWIAGELNSRRTPSPDSGRMRKNAAGRHRVSGQWSHGTVKHLITNPAIVGILRYGTKSEGTHRRHGSNGARLLEESDRRVDGSPKPIRNSPELLIERPAGFETLAEKALFDDCQKLAKKRGQSQRGIPKTRDPARYPLASRVFDLTGGCGHPMYALTSGNRPLYECGRYLKSGGVECAHNVVDGEALAQFAVSLLRQQILQFGGRDSLKAELAKLASKEGENRPKVNHQEQLHLSRELMDAKAELKIMEHNLARANSQELFDLISHEHDGQLRKIRQLGDQIEIMNSNAKGNVKLSAAAEIDKAMSLFDRLETVTRDSSARTDLKAVFDDLDLQIGLYFVEGLKGTKRKVRILNSGIVVTGGQPLPVKPYGKDYIAPPKLGCEDPTVSVNRPDRSKSAEERKPQEGVSFTKVNRGD